jgi:hypothetical protein
MLDSARRILEQSRLQVPRARHWLLCEGGWCLLLEALDSERPQNVDEKLLLGGVVALESLFGDLHLTSFLSRQLLGELRRHRVGEKRRLGVITRRHMYCVLVILWHAIRMKLSDYVRQVSLTKPPSSDRGLGNWVPADRRHHHAGVESRGARLTSTRVTPPIERVEEA